MQKELKLINIHPKAKKEMAKLFHIGIKFKKTKVDDLFDSCLEDNLIEKVLLSTWIGSS